MWMIRKARPEVAPVVPAPGAGGTVSSDVMEAAKARLRLAVEHGFKISNNDLAAQFRLTRAEVTTVRQSVLAATNGHPPEITSEMPPETGSADLTT
jgi:hypothetical protein